MKRYPTTEALLESGLIVADYATTTYIGRASDGTEVTVGGFANSSERRRTESYLTANPTPDRW